MSRPERGPDRPPRPRRRWPPVPLFAAVLVVMTVVAAVVVVTVAVPGSDTGAPPVPTGPPTPPTSTEPIPEAVAIAFSRPIRPEERPGDTQVVAVPSPGQVEAEGRKDWPEAAFSAWVECTDLLDRKQFDQAISRMNEVASRSADRGVRAVTATCRAAAKVNNGDFSDAEPDLDEARREIESLPPEARVDVETAGDLAELPIAVNTYALAVVATAPGESASSAAAGLTQSALRKFESRISQLNLKLQPAMADPRSDSLPKATLQNRYAAIVGMSLSTCWGLTNGNPICQQLAVRVAEPLPRPLARSVVAAIATFRQKFDPVNPPLPVSPGQATSSTRPESPTTTTTTESRTTTTEEASATPTTESTTATSTAATDGADSTAGATTTTKPTTATTTTRPTTAKTTTPSKTTAKTTTRKTTTTTTTPEADNGG